MLAASSPGVLQQHTYYTGYNYVRMYVCTYVHTYILLKAYKHNKVYIRTYICMYVCCVQYVHMYVCTYVALHQRFLLHVYVSSDNLKHMLASKYDGLGVFEILISMHHAA